MTLRASGILLHLTSLPSEFGIGDLGPQAHRFVSVQNGWTNELGARSVTAV